MMLFVGGLLYLYPRLNFFTIHTHTLRTFYYGHNITNHGQTKLIIYWLRNESTSRALHMDQMKFHWRYKLERTIYNYAGYISQKVSSQLSVYKFLQPVCRECSNKFILNIDKINKLNRKELDIGLPLIISLEYYSTF